jgi:hypothetical protein
VIEGFKSYKDQTILDPFSNKVNVVGESIATLPLAAAGAGGCGSLREACLQTCSCRPANQWQRQLHSLTFASCVPCWCSSCPLCPPFLLPLPQSVPMALENQTSLLVGAPAVASCCIAWRMQAVWVARESCCTAFVGGACPPCCLPTLSHHPPTPARPSHCPFCHPPCLQPSASCWMTSLARCQWTTAAACCT